MVSQAMVYEPWDDPLIQANVRSVVIQGVVHHQGEVNIWKRRGGQKFLVLQTGRGVWHGKAKISTLQSGFRTTDSTPAAVVKHLACLSMFHNFIAELGSHWLETSLTPCQVVPAVCLPLPPFPHICIYLNCSNKQDHFSQKRKEGNFAHP